MLDKLRQLAIFAKTVDHGSFRAAAKALRLSPSVVSHHVGQLEQTLGTALLYRSTRRLSLTPDGERLLEAARTMIDAAESGLQGIGNQSIRPSGLLRLTVPALLAPSELTSLLAKFAVDCPEVRLSLDFSDTRRDLIADGFDMAISVGELKDSALKAKKLFEINRKLVAAPAYLDKHPAAVTPIDLEHWDWIELAPVWHKKIVFRQGAKHCSVQRGKAQISVNNAQALGQLARAGAGLAVVPEFLSQADIASGALCSVVDDWSVDALDVFAVWPANAPDNGLSKHFLKFFSDATQQTSRAAK